MTATKHVSRKQKRARVLGVLLVPAMLLVLGQAAGTTRAGQAEGNQTDGPQSNPKSSVSDQQEPVEGQIQAADQTMPASSQGADVTGQAAGSLPAWLEPRGLSIVELVGIVPEEYLQGTIIAYNGASGIAVYEAGSRMGNVVEITTTIYTRFFTPSWAPNHKMTRFTCLGQIPFLDSPGTVIPESKLRIYDSNGQERTSEIKDMFVSKMGVRQPSGGTRSYDRYPLEHHGLGGNIPLQIGPDGLVIPANSGCHIQLHGAHYFPLTGVFTFNFEPQVDASVLGTQQASFQSYIGPGDVGLFTPLMNQLAGRYDWRHGRIPLQVPAGANYFLLKYPAMPVDPYTDMADHVYDNVGRPTSGTYRLAGEGDTLASDLQVSGAFPLDVAWKDADLSSGSRFLPLIRQPRVLTPLEYIVPAGVAYNDCFLQGNCPTSILQQIHNAVMTLEVIYLSVDTVGSAGQWTSIKMAGPAWSPSEMQPSSDAQVAQTAPTEGTEPLGPGETPERPWTVFLPSLSKAKQLPTGCPCGWFDSAGRMLTYLP